MTIVYICIVLSEAHDFDTTIHYYKYDNRNNSHLNNEKKLIDNLLHDYQVKFGRPVNNMSEKVVVLFEVYLIQIIDLVYNKQYKYENVKNWTFYRDFT